MTDIILHKINDVPVGHRKSDGYLNATKLCLSYQMKTGKTRKPNDWTKTKRAKELVEYISRITNIPAIDLIQSRAGASDESGTWIHPDLATAFGTWLSVEFEYAIGKWLQEWQENKLHNSFPGNVNGAIPKNPLIEGVQVIDAIAETVFKKSVMKDSIKLEMIGCQFPDYRPAIEAAKKTTTVILKSVLLTPTELGSRFEPPLSAIKVNRLLIEQGLQSKTGNKQCPYIAEGRGHDHSELVADTAKGHAKTIQKLRWYETVIDLIKG